MIPGKRYTAEDFLRIAWRRKWVIAIPFVVASVATYVIVKHLPNRYQSKTLILVVPQRVPDSYVHSTVSAPIEDRLRSISEQILSRSRLERIIRDFNLYAKERQRLTTEDVVEKFHKLAGHAAPAAQVASIRDAVLNLEKLPDAGQLARLMARTRAN